ncbi:MAG: roadblock/LC7 domain-containing protein [Desulfuromonas sp.]|nr:roadblock/LC7 domain-containing protein [Desulfuromonas sp.]
MPFKGILAELVSDELGVCSAILADWEGEAVDWLSSGRCAEDIKLFGAHLGIVLNQMCRIAVAADSGDVQEIAIRMYGADWFVFPITSEYYLAVAAAHRGQRAKICHIAQRCVERLRVEVG